MTRLWERFRAYYSQLSGREQVLLAAAALVIVVVGGYLGIVQPLIDRETRVAAELSDKRALRDWLVGAAREARALSQSGTAGSGPVAPASPSVVQQSLRDHQLDASVVRMEPTPDGIDIELKKAPLNLLIGWVTVAETSLGYVATSATLVRGEEPGTTDAKLHLAPGTSS